MGATCPHCEFRCKNARGVLRHIKLTPSHRVRHPRLWETMFAKKVSGIVHNAKLSSKQKITQIQCLIEAFRQRDIETASTVLGLR